MESSPPPSFDDPETAALRAAVAEAIAEIDAGYYIPHEEMRRWLLSWGTDNELPPPSVQRRQSR